MSNDNATLKETMPVESPKYIAYEGNIYLTTPFGDVKIMEHLSIVLPIKEFAEHIVNLLNVETIKESKS